MEEDRGTLKEDEPHPAAYLAKRYVHSFSIHELFGFLEAFSSCAIEGNRLGEICGETLRRILNSEPVSDRYMLGLAWAIKDIKEREYGS